eukprot:6492924-Lingulodinium_polyedra.AAC.1
MAAPGRAARCESGRKLPPVPYRNCCSRRSGPTALSQNGYGRCDDSTKDLAAIMSRPWRCDCD